VRLRGDEQLRLGSGELATMSQPEQTGKFLPFPLKRFTNLLLLLLNGLLFTVNKLAIIP